MDFRFVVDVDGKEIDVGAGEAASEVCSKEKIIHDEGKLVREGKDVLDGLIQYCINFSIDDLMGMIIQTSEREPFLSTLENLLGMVEKMEEMAILVTKSSLFFINQRLSFGKHLGRPSELHLNDVNNYLSWIGETYYFPSNDEHHKSVIPKINCINEFDVDGSKIKAAVQEKKDDEYEEADVDEWRFVLCFGKVI
ncbi:hypothetical protein G6F37_012121 [Rhizopus arrhizus]|nr:hypothetical protein G6F38_012172 [Rhizopus arrhizus]KAG1145585.1 hypothetical protein G6F37_012121 [Rhizopus arrhizus]